MKKTGFLVLAIGMIFLVNKAEAFVIDLTTAGSSGTINSALFIQGSSGISGSGVFDSFVRINGPSIEQGYNTSGRPLRFDENTSPVFTRDLLLNNVSTVYISGLLYREFFLDINQNSPNPYLSLDELKIYLNTTGGLNPLNPDSLGTLVYNMDAGDASNYVKLNYNLESGSGRADMSLYVLDSLFDRTNTYAYLYSKLGVNFSNNDGYEEWAVRKDVVHEDIIPEPATLSLLGLGLFGLMGLKRKRT